MYLTLFFNESIEYTDHYHLETGECVRTLLIVRKRIFLTQRNNFFYPVGLDTRKNFINHKKEFFLLATRLLARVQAACVEHVPSRSSDLVATILLRCCRWRAAAVARRLPEICAAGRVVWVARAARRSASPPRASVVACAVHGLALASAREQRSTSIASWLEVALLRLSQLVEERWRATCASRVALSCNGIIYPSCASATRFCSAYWQTASVRAPLHASDLAADI